MVKIFSTIKCTESYEKLGSPRIPAKGLFDSVTRVLLKQPRNKYSQEQHKRLLQGAAHSYKDLEANSIPKEGPLGPLLLCSAYRPTL